MYDTIVEAFLSAARHSFLSESSFILSCRDSASGEISIYRSSSGDVCEISNSDSNISVLIQKLYSLSEGVESIALLFDGYARSLSSVRESVEIKNGFARDYFGETIEIVNEDFDKIIVADKLPKALIISGICASVMTTSPLKSVEAAYVLEAYAKREYILKSPSQ